LIGLAVLLAVIFGGSGFIAWMLLPHALLLLVPAPLVLAPRARRKLRHRRCLRNIADLEAENEIGPPWWCLELGSSDTATGRTRCPTRSGSSGGRCAMSLVVFCKVHGPLYDTHQYIGDCVDLSKWEALTDIPVPNPADHLAWTCPARGCRRTLKYDERKTFETAILLAIHHGFRIKVRELVRPSRV
jgi:hypothetical protein